MLFQFVAFFSVFQTKSFMTDIAFFLIVTLDLNKAKRWSSHIPEECQVQTKGLL